MVLLNLPLIDRAKEIAARLESDEFGYGGRVLLIHSKSEDEEEQQLIELEKETSKVEIVVHVNRLREGWDVRNIFTIVPMRAIISDTLTAQTIGRGVRLPFGANNREELANPEVATLSVICYQTGRDNYARIIESASSSAQEREPRMLTRSRRPSGIKVGLQGKTSKLKVPSLSRRRLSSAKLKPFTPKVQVSDEKALARLVGVDVLSGEKEEDLGAATTQTIDDLELATARPDRQGAGARAGRCADDRKVGEELPNQGQWLQEEGGVGEVPGEQATLRW